MLRTTYESVEGLHLEAKKRALALPNNDSLNRIIRYQASIDRDFYKAMQQLERLGV